MSFIGGYQSDVNLNDINYVGDFPIDHAIGGFGLAIETAVNTYSLTLAPAISQYRVGLPLAVAFNGSNTGPVTLNVNNRGAKLIKKVDEGNLLDLELNDLVENKIYLLIYDGNTFQVANSSHFIFDASETRKGISKIATLAETLAGLNDFKFVSPLKLAGLVNTLAATQQEVNEGLIGTKAVTPLTLANYIADKITGLWEDKGVFSGAGNPLYPPGQVGDAYTVNIAGKIGGAFGQNIGVRDVIYCNTDNDGGDEENVGFCWTIIQANLEAATELVAGYLRIATQAEVNAGANNATAVSPLKLKTLLDARIATEVLTGLIELATQAEVNAGADDVRAVTSLKLMTLLNALLKYQAGAGANSIIPKLGANNTAPGSHAAVLNGNNNRANNTFSAAIGSFADAWQFNEYAKSPGAFFNTQGSVQHSVLTIWNIIPSNGGIYPVNLDGGGSSASNRWRVPNNTLIHFMLQFSLVQNSGSAGTIGDTWTAIYEGVAKNVNGSISWVGGAPSVREIRQDAGLSPSVSISASGNEIIPIVIAIPNKNLHANITAYITQTKFNLS